MTLHLLTPEWSRTAEVGQVFLPGSEAPFEVLKGHAAIISTLDEGKVRWCLPDGSPGETVEIKGGIVRVKDDIIEICAQI